MTRRKPIPPLGSDDTEPLFPPGDSGDNITRFTLEDNPSVGAPEPNRYSFYDPSLVGEPSGLPSFPGMIRFSEEDRAVLSPISERPERQSSKASSTARSSSTAVGGSVQNGSVFGQVMQSVEASYPSQPGWDQSAHLQQPPPQQQAYSAGYHGMLLSRAVCPRLKN